MSDGFYKRRRGVVEHIESGVIDVLMDGIHDYLSLKSNLVIGNGSYLPAGVIFTSARALHPYCKRWLSERTLQRVLAYMEEIAWLKTWKQTGKHGNYPTLLCRASVHDLSGNEYRVSGEKTTDWRKPVYELVGELSASCPQSVPDLATLREVREESKEKRERKPAAKTMPPADPRHQSFVDFAAKAFEQKHSQKPTWTGKDFKALSVMLASNKGLGADELEKRFGNYLASTEAFTQKQGDSLAYFCAHVDSFLAGPMLAAPQKGGINADQRTSDNLRAAGLLPN